MKAKNNAGVKSVVLNDLLGVILCKINSHNYKTVAYGYPAFKKTWVTYYECKRCGHILREWDDLFADTRPDDWPIEKEVMNYDP